MTRAPTTTRCLDGRTMRHDPQPDDPSLETDIGQCEECDGDGCEREGGPISGLIACPRCGSSATAEGPIMRQGWTVSCDNTACEASTLIWDTEAEAARAWNAKEIQS